MKNQTDYEIEVQRFRSVTFEKVFHSSVFRPSFQFILLDRRFSNRYLKQISTFYFFHKLKHVRTISTNNLPLSSKLKWKDDESLSRIMFLEKPWHIRWGMSPSCNPKMSSISIITVRHNEVEPIVRDIKIIVITNSRHLTFLLISNPDFVSKGIFFQWKVNLLSIVRIFPFAVIHNSKNLWTD